ncbi:hypothetical protein [Streptomyces olivaceus]|uniref:hypothetical protein n=1 Tax=Streptomyces olivaceus TaxID=47716 RepID=UPI001CCB6E48|nr:hypothetical protein [Streptomyces olivaceus]
MSDGNDARRDARDADDAHGADDVREAEVVDADQQSKHTHTGNGTVNHGPADQGSDPQAGSEPEEPVLPDTDTRSGPDGPDGGAGGGGGLDADELALRRMLQGAVQDVRPGDGSLEHLRRAVPARRARKRQAVVGAAAAALFLGTAVPALVHVSNSTGRDADPSVAGNASQAQGGASQGKDPAGGQSGVAGSGEKTEGGDRTGPTETPGDKESGSARGSAPGVEPSASTAADVPACTARQLGPAEVASIAEPDSVGVVYGSFRVANVSSAGCTVTDPGSVVTTSLGTADTSRIGTARHAAGDAAAGLPDPSMEAASLPLAPASSYEVQFAWVPSETCATPGGGNGGDAGGPTADPSPTGDTSAAGGTSTAGSEAGPTTQLLTKDGPADGSVSVTYRPAGGSGPATATVSNACAGTVYWTGVLAGTGS